MSASCTAPFEPRAIALWCILIGTILVLVLHGRIPQAPEYHAFADQRQLFGIPRVADTASNVPLLAAGVGGLLLLRRAVPAGGLAPLRRAYLTFFAATALIAPGSAYYHLHPSNATLFWDRLPMTFAFMAFFAIVLGEYISPPFALRSLPFLLVAGALSVFYWRLTDSGNGGDLRAYVIVQYLPMLIILVTMLLYRSPLEPVRYLWAVLVSYGLAIALELLDRPIFRALGFVSGHTLKHLAAALAVFFFFFALKRRRLRIVRPASLAAGVTAASLASAAEPGTQAHSWRHR